MKAKRNQEQTSGYMAQRRQILSKNTNFAIQEAYKSLRTNISFSIRGNKCKKFCITSGASGEGKSITLLNLAISIAQTGKKVLLIDCDMRRPSLATKLPIQKAPGLSDFLAGQSHSDNLIQHCGLKDNERAFHVVSAGRNPPNPMELLSSARMAKMIDRLRQNYDYIILDLPPVNLVSDALAVSKYITGMIVVIRQEYTEKKELATCFRQLRLSNVNVLGCVMNETTSDRGYYSKYKYKRYYRYYKHYSTYETPEKK